MVVVLSRFRVANDMETDVARAFRERPRAVEDASGFLWLEVFADENDPTVFYLLTRWTHYDAFKKWHESPAHRHSHAFIPKGLKLDAAFTKVFTLTRLDGTTGSALTDHVSDATLLLDRLVQASNAMYLLVVDLDGTIRTTNPAVSQQLAGGESLAGRSLWDFMPSADSARLRALLTAPPQRLMQLQLSVAAEQRVPFTLDCWLDVQRDHATVIGQPTFRREQQLQDELMAINQELAVLSRDRAREMQAERHARELAERTNRERNAFLHVLAHELRQPIGGALAAMTVLRKINPDPQLEQPRAMLERQLKQITRLVEDLTTTARVAGGEVELRRTDVDLVNQLRELSEAWNATALEQHKIFSCRLPQRPVRLWADPERLQQVFSNLLDNALKYTAPGGAVSVILETDERWATVTVQDQGEGIAPERLSRVFELFQRSTTTGTGLGVGLSVVQGLVAAHGGTIAAASEGLGKGATFTVKLPLRSSSRTHAAIGT